MTTSWSTRPEFKCPKTCRCLKRWEMTNNLTNYPSLTICVVLDAFWSDLPALMNLPFVVAVRSSRPTRGFARVRLCNEMMAVEAGSARALSRAGTSEWRIRCRVNLVRSSQAKPFHEAKGFSQFLNKMETFVCKWNSVWNGGLIKCYLGSIKTFCCYEIRAFWSKFVLWKRVDVLLCENNDNELHVGKIISKWKLKIFHARNVHMGYFNLLGMLCFGTRSSGNKILPELTIYFFKALWIREKGHSSLRRNFTAKKDFACNLLSLSNRIWTLGHDFQVASTAAKGALDSGPYC